MRDRHTRHGTGSMMRWIALMVTAVALLAGAVLPQAAYAMHAAAPAAQTEQPTDTEREADADDEVSPAQPFLDEGAAALEMGDIEAALEAYSQAIEADPDEAAGYSGRALSYGILDELDAALADADQAVALAPNDADSALLRAEILQALGDLEGTEAEVDRLLAVTNDGADLDMLPRVQALFTRSQARLSRGDLTGAVEDYAAILRTDPMLLEFFGEYRRLAGSAALMDEKVAEYARFAEESDSPGAADYADGMQQLLLAQLTQSPDAYAPAVEALTVAIEADPELAAAYHARGIARMGAAALQQLMGTVHVGPDSASYTDPETGEEVTVTREEWDADWELQQQLLSAARTEAIEDLSRAVELDAENAEFVHDLGVAHFAQQEAYAGAVYSTPDAAGRDEALTLFNQAVELAPEWDQARLSRAIASLLWGMQDFNTLRFSEDKTVADIVYADDGSIVVLYDDTTFDRWNAKSGDLLESNAELLVEDWGYGSKALSPDGDSVVTSNYVDGTQIWDRTSGDEAVALEGFEAGYERAVFSNDGALVAAADRETATVWDAESGEMLMQGAGSDPIALSPEGSHLLAGSGPGNPDMILLDVASGMTGTVLTGPVNNDDRWGVVLPYYPEEAAFSPDGHTVAVVGTGGAIRVWDVREEEEARVLNRAGDARSRWFLDFSPDGSLIVATTSDGRMAVYEVETGEQLSVFSEAVEYDPSEYAPTFNPDGTQVVSALPGGTLNIREARTGELITTLQRDGTAEEVALERSSEALLQQAIDDANLLIEREAGAGWPYVVRGTATRYQAEVEGGELNADSQEQIEADWQAFTRLSPDVRPDDWISYMPGEVRFSSPVAPPVPLMAGRIEYTDDGRIFIHEAEGFQLQIPDQGPTGGVADVYVPGGPGLVRITDDFREFTLIVMDNELGDLSAEEWLGEMMMAPGSVESTGSFQTELGEVYMVTQREADLTAAILPVDGRIFYLSYTPAWLAVEGGSFANGYGLKLNPRREVAIDFVKGLSLLAE